MKLRPGLSALEPEKKTSKEEEDSQNGDSTSSEGEAVVEETVTTNNGVTSPNSLPSVRIWGRAYNLVILITHLNICLYATCFWIQIGALPVSGC